MSAENSDSKRVNTAFAQAANGTWWWYVMHVDRQGVGAVLKGGQVDTLGHAMRRATEWAESHGYKIMEVW